MDGDAKIFEYFSPMVERWVKGYASKKSIRHELDDLLGVANLRLVEVVERFRPEILKDFDGNLEKFSVYLRLSIQTAMSDYLRHLSRNDHLPLHVRLEPLVFENDPIDLLDTRRAVLDSIKDSIDARIVQAKLDGAVTGREVEEKTGIPRITVYRRLRLMKKRYDKSS